MVLALSDKRSIDGEELLVLFLGILLRTGLVKAFALPALLPPAALVVLFHITGDGDCNMEPGVVVPSVSTSPSSTLSNGPLIVVVNGNDSNGV